MDSSDPKWRKPTRSNGSGNCVEAGQDAPRSRVLVRDTKQDHLGDTRTVLTVSADAWGKFTASLR